MMYGIHLLLATRGVSEKLKLELRRIWPNRETPITYRELEKSQYFVSNLFVCVRQVRLTVPKAACIKEILRMSIPVPGKLPRIVPAEGLNIDQWHIPGGVRLA